VSDKPGRFQSTYLTIDVRTLGLARLFIGSLLLFDLVKRSVDLEYWYTEDGLLPVELLGKAPVSIWRHGFMAAFRTEHEVAVVLSVIALVYFCFLIGLKTRFFHRASFVCLASLQLRVDLLSNGGDVVFCGLLLWTAFLPLGAAFSIDARRRTRTGASISSPVVSLGVLAVLLQLSTIYYFSAVHKAGQNWLDGTAVYYLTHQERMVTWLGLWMRENMPLVVFQMLTYFALATEYVLPALILSPWGRPWTRRVAIALIWGLHCGIAAMANVGVFSAVMLSYSILLVSTDDWEWLRSRAAARFGDDHRLTRALSLTSPTPEMETRRASPRRRRLRTASNVVLVCLMLITTSQVLAENRGVPKWLKPTQPRWVKTTVHMLRLGQGWHMFSPNAPYSEKHLVVDAVTADGRRVDPFNSLGARVADPTLRRIAPRVTQNYYWGDYTARIYGRKEHTDVLRHWIMRHHERTGNENDRIETFRAYTITQECPAPGEDAPRKTIAKRILIQR
jgi:hypothetical protein